MNTMVDAFKKATERTNDKQLAETVKKSVKSISKLPPDPGQNTNNRRNQN